MRRRLTAEPTDRRQHDLGNGHVQLPSQRSEDHEEDGAELCQSQDQQGRLGDFAEATHRATLPVPVASPAGVKVRYLAGLHPGLLEALLDVLPAKADHSSLPGPKVRTIYVRLELAAVDEDVDAAHVQPKEPCRGLDRDLLVSFSRHWC